MLYSSTHAPIYLYETFAQANAKLSTQYLSLFFLLLCKKRGLLLLCWMAIVRENIGAIFAMGLLTNTAKLCYEELYHY